MSKAFLFILLIISCHSLKAQDRPDAGSIQKQIEDQRSKSPLPLKEESKKISIEALESDTSISVVVHQFIYSGNTLIQSEELDLITKPYLERSLNFEQLDFISTEIASLYRKKGWVVHIFLPEQNIDKGIVTIEIIEASLGKVETEGSPQHISESRITPFITHKNLVGEKINSKTLDRGLLLADDLPGVKVYGLLKPGDISKTADLKLKLTDDPRIDGNIYLDNMGIRSTGAVRIGTNLNLNDPIKIGDQLSFSAQHTHGSDYYRLSYAIPIGYDGLRIGVNGAHLDYNLITANLASLDAFGSFGSFGFELQYPIIRSKLSNLYFVGNIDHKDYKNQAQGQLTSLYQINNKTLSLYGNIFDTLFGGGSNSASISLIKGRLNLDGSPTQTLDSYSTKTAGEFSVIRYAMSREQTLYGPFSAYAGLSGQIAYDNLDSSEKFYLGGPNGIRAYPMNEQGGASGSLLKLELRGAFPKNIGGSLFYDLGHVSINHNNNYTGASNINNLTMKGVGLSVNWQSSNGFKVSSTWSKRIGDNPNPTSTGQDQDGSYQETRWWINTSYNF
jgi:hemolysin activation/secretion protein